MGQGYSLTTLSAGAAGIDVPELADLIYEKSLGNARFMKCIRARSKDGLVVAKVVMKPYSTMKLDQYVKKLISERRILAGIPNTLGYHRILETSTNGYLVRQYIHSSLYDRMSTRPFLEDIEKKWLAFQLLCAVRDCHSNNVYHGDIKTENILVTSWNWLYLCDFSSSFKPTYLPEDDPADFSFYFDTSGRRTCYLAPERFLSPGAHPEDAGRVNWAMDIFSVGCVIAELFLETPIFSLSQLFKYRQGDYEPELAHLNKIHDPDIRELVSHMIQLDPESRYAAEEYLNFWRRKAFPDYFYTFLHQYMYTITDPTSGQKPVTAGTENLGESDERIDKIYNDFDKISYSLGSENGEDLAKNPASLQSITAPLFPLQIDIPNYRHQASVKSQRAADDGTLIFLSVVLSSLRSTARASARIRACELLLAFAESATDEAKLDRVLPYLMVMLNDKSDLVKIAALRTLTQLLATVSVVSPINAYIFPEYILPRLQPFVLSLGQKEEPSVLVRMTLASCLDSLATTALRFLDITQALRADGSLPTSDPEAEDEGISRSVYQTLYDAAREDLIGQFEVLATALVTDADSSVRRAFLGSVASLCVFFGSTRVNDVLLSHLNTYLNDRDWMLKCAFFETIVGVATYIGGVSLEEFILPLMLQALADPEEFVVERVIRSLASMSELGLFQRSKQWELVDIVGRFMCHPNNWIREAAAQFISTSTIYLSAADVHCIIIPLVAPYLRVVPSDLSELKILDSLKKPLPRLVMDMATTWASSAENSMFWAPARQNGSFQLRPLENAILAISGRDLGPRVINKVAKSPEDEQWFTRLRNAGMTQEDEIKLLALREYIRRVAHRKSKSEYKEQQQPSIFNTIVPLKTFGITPQTVFFEPVNDVYEGRETAGERRTISDALLDASTTVDDPLSRRKLSHKNSHADWLSKNDALQPKASPELNPLSPTLKPRTSLDIPQASRRESLQSQTTKEAESPLDSPVGSIGSPNTLRHGDHGSRRVRHKGSAISLLGRGDSGNKAMPEIGTTSANAFGKVEGGSGSSRDVSVTRRRSPSTHPPEKVRRTKAVHSYTGTEPTVLKLLDTLYLDNYPSDLAEFGPPVKTLSGRQPIHGSAQNQSNPWRPEGVLVGIMGEHTAAINRVVVAPDHAFFVTGSDDGSAKVWDTTRLERNVTYRSRCTYKLAEGAKVTTLAFIEGTHSLVITGSDGSVHVIKIPYNPSHGVPKYGKVQLLREYRLPEGEYTRWSDHYKHDNQSILVLATNLSRVVFLELRTMTELFELQNPLHHGTLTSFCVDRKHDWLLLGTSHGVLDLWDLRFKLRLKAWSLYGSTPVHRIVLQKGPGGRKSRVYIAGGTGPGEITVWDLEKKVCKEVYRTGLAKDSVNSLTLTDVDEERPGGMLGRFATSLEPNSTTGADRGVRALAVGAHVPENGEDPKQFFFVSTGPDWKVRFWDCTRFDTSMVVSGLAFEEAKPTYSVSQPAPETIVVNERLAAPPSLAASAATSGSRSSGRSTPNTSARRTSTSGGSKTSRSTVISLQQQHLLKSHLDTITDVAILEFPYGMIVSVDRSGVIYIFQ